MSFLSNLTGRDYKFFGAGAAVGVAGTIGVQKILKSRKKKKEEEEDGKDRKSDRKSS